MLKCAGEEGVLKSTKPKILIVDDETANLKILREILRDDADIQAAKSGEQALAIASKQQLTLILLDVVMPEMDGFEVIKQLKSDERTRAIPVIFITGLRDVDNEEKGFALGACDYIQKPFHAAIVSARVKLHLELIHQRQLLTELAHIDPLTSLGNRRKFDYVLELEWSIAKREHTSLAILMIDIDFFKNFNDNYGHSAGDEVIQTVGMALKNQFSRPRDFVGRYGGEEFVVVLPNTCGELLQDKIQKCCDAIANLNIEHERSDVCNVVTVSIGGALCEPVVSGYAEQVVKAADTQLYHAKKGGRNQVRWQEFKTNCIKV